MSRFSFSLCFLAAIGAFLSAAAAPGAQPLTPPPMPASAVSQPPPKSPVDTFRELLALSPAERKKALADRPPEAQKRIMAKVREYESLNPNQRELRLKVTELYYYLWPLMNTPATNRAAQLALVPERDRLEIEQRLQAWDDLPPAKQQELLSNEATVRFFTELQSGPPPMPPASLAQQNKLQRGIHQWQALPKERQEKIMARFTRFFELTPEEKGKALTTLNEPERRQIERTLARFESLSQEDRVQCLRSFQKFAGMSMAERQQFLKNVERWKLMTPDEREDWRELVKEFPPQPPMPPGMNLSPPVPPGFRFQRPSLPPHPPGFSATVATNH